MEEVEARITPSNLNLSAAAMPSIVTLDSPAMISGSVSASEPMSTLSFTYVWGDSSSTTDPHTFSVPNAVYPFTMLHSYSVAGEYSITVTASATYAGGGSDSAQATYSVTVLNPTSPPPPPPPPPPPAVADVRVDAIFNTSESATDPVGQFDLVRIGGDLKQPMTVTYTVAGTAGPGMDYQSLIGSATFAAHATTATVTVTSLEDLLIEGNETVVMTLLPNPLLYHVLTPAGMDTLVIADNDQPPTGNGTGLFGRYYNTETLTDVKAARIDPIVNFDWAAAAPMIEVGADHFSTRWTGKVQPRYSGEYTFTRPRTMVCACGSTMFRCSTSGTTRRMHRGRARLRCRRWRSTTSRSSIEKVRAQLPSALNGKVRCSKRK